MAHERVVRLMAGVLSFYRCLGQAVLVKAPRGLLGLVPGGEFVHDVAIEYWERWCKLPEANSQALNQQLQTAASADPAALAQQMQQVDGNQPPEVQQALADYLSQVASRIRATFSSLGLPAALVPS